MSLLLDSTSVTSHDAAGADKAAKSLEALVLKQLLQSSGLFHGNDTAGSSIRSDLFAEALAEAVTEAGGLGLASQLSGSIPTPLPGPGPQASPELVDPTKLVVGGHLTSGFGGRVDPINGQESVHTGIDVGAPEGTPILAASDGVVRRAGERGGYGISVELDHGNGVSTLYGHASELLVQEGQQVHKGTPIAKVGHTGRSTGSHLHFEVRHKGIPTDPTRALKAYTARDE
jgi:murein DD-endopeptidase MepM/ murein hydrolase activator NlpD